MARISLLPFICVISVMPTVVEEYIELLSFVYVFLSLDYKGLVRSQKVQDNYSSLLYTVFAFFAFFGCFGCWLIVSHFFSRTKKKIDLFTGKKKSL